MRMWAFLLLSLVAVSAYALPTLDDVEHAVHRGDYTAAESMTREVVAARPDNAKAHYILAELLAHQGRVAEARTQAATALKLDPQIHFTAPERFRQFEAELRGGKSAAPAATANTAPRKAAEESGGGSSVLWIVLLLGAGALFLFLRRPNTPPGYGNAYPTAPSGMPPGGYSAAQGYPPGYGPVNPPSGISPVAAGLGGIAAGMVAEHLIEGALDRHHDHTAPPVGGNTDSPLFGPPSGSASLEDRPIDFGNGGDWGGDSGGGGSDGGDSGGGFDSGSSSDWS